MHVLLVDDRLDLDWFEAAELGRYEIVLCLFWAAPETLARLAERTGGVIFGILDVVGTVYAWEKSATEIVEVICGSGPKYRGLCWRNYLDERLYVQALGLELMRRAIVLLQEKVGRDTTSLEIEYVLQRDLQKDFDLIRETEGIVCRARNVALGLSGTRLEARPSLPVRLWRRRQAARRSGAWSVQGRELLAQMDSRYQWRAMGARLRWQPRAHSTGCIAFFSSYANNSRTLAKYQVQRHVDAARVDWVLLTDSAALGAMGVQGNITWLWEYADGRTTPAEVQDTPSVETEPNGERRALLERWLGSLQVWTDWVTSELPTLVQVTRFWEAYLEWARPASVVMANQWSVEGWLMQVTRAHGTRVVQLMHGALGGYFYTQRPIKSDELHVWGDFWRDMFSASDRAKIVVEDVADFFAKVGRVPTARRTVTFFSWPLVEIPFYNASELLGGMLALLHERAEAGDGVILRLHPQEDAATVIDLWEKWFGTLPPQVRVSQSESLANVLKETDVALMFRSTVFFDCGVNGIPVVMLAWTDFGWNERLQGEAGVYLAGGWKDLGNMTKECLEGEQREVLAVHN